MAIQFPCKSCGQTLSVADEHAGKQSRCPSCMTVQPVPGGASSPPSVASNFGGSVFDPPPSETPKPPPSDSLFGPFTPTPPASSNTNSGGSSNSGGGLFDGLGVDKKEPAPASSSSSGPVDLFGSLSGQTPNSGSSAGQASSSQSEMYYLEAPGGSVYGPVDWRTLVAWKNQGRVGPGFRIRKGENGAWQVASSTELYTSSANPFADTIPSASYNSGPQYNYPYSQQDRSGLILVLGILAWVLTLGCGPFGTILGILAWVFGAQDLAAVRAGRLDSRTISTIQVGYYLGMIQVLLSVLCFGGYILMVVIAIISDL